MFQSYQFFLTLGCVDDSQRNFITYTNTYFASQEQKLLMVSCLTPYSINIMLFVQYPITKGIIRFQSKVVDTSSWRYLYLELDSRNLYILYPMDIIQCHLNGNLFNLYWFATHNSNMSLCGDLCYFLEIIYFKQQYQI